MSLNIDYHVCQPFLVNRFSSCVMTNLPGTRTSLKKTIGNLYGQRTWVEYGFRQCKQELGWTDYRLTKAEDILKWWEIINSVYWMISINTKPLRILWQKSGCGNEVMTESLPAEVPSARERAPRRDNSSSEKKEKTSINHHDWRECNSWKNTLINYRIMIQPMIIFCTILPWLKIIPSEILWSGFNDLLGCANHYMIHFLSG